MTDRHKSSANDPTIEVTQGMRDASTNEQLSDLLLRWEKLRDEGTTITVDELCTNCPDLAAPLQARIEALQAMDGALSGSGGESSTTIPTVPGYEIECEIGRGGMGIVYRARQVGLARTVALKMIVTGQAANKGQTQRFRREAEAVAQLQHPNIVQIHEIAEQGGLPFFSLEFVEGGNLADALQGAPQAANASAELCRTLGRAIHAAHQRDVVHRDLKPSNVLLTVDGTPKITDFGIAKKLDAADSHTQTGSILGTPSYMSPEQATSDAEAIGPRTDVYAIGAILYEMLTGRPPFLGTTPWETIQAVVSDEPVPPRRLYSKIPRDLETICLKCLEKTPDRRYATGEDLAEDLNRFLTEQPIQARPTGSFRRAVKFCRRRPATASLVLVAVIALLAFLGMGALYNSRLKAANQNLETEISEKQKLLALSFVAYGRTCALAAKEANLDDPLVVMTSRSPQISASNERQFELEYELLLHAGAPSVRPALEAFRTAMQAAKRGDERGDLRQLALELAHACGRAWQSTTAETPFLQEMIRQHLYRRACSVVDKLATGGTLNQSRHEYAEFWELFWGEMAIVESTEVETAMVQFGELLKQWKQKGIHTAPGDLRPQLQQRAQTLRKACGLEVAT